MGMVELYEDVLTHSAQQMEEQWNTDGFVITAGRLALLDRTDEAKALVSEVWPNTPVY